MAQTGSGSRWIREGGLISELSILSEDEQAYRLAIGVANAVQAQKGDEVVVLDLRESTEVTDYFVLATARNRVHLAALADHLEDDFGRQIQHREGRGQASWVLLDMGSVVVHLFLAETRSFYDLERLWGDAEHVAIGPG